MTLTPRVRLESEGVEAVLDPGAGGRIAELRVDGLDLIVPHGWGTLAWGAYPMIPWAGRLRNGAFDWRGETVRVEQTEPPHAIHGTALHRAWRLVAATAESATMALDLRPDWPFGGRAVHRVDLDPAGLTSTIEVHAGRPMPAIIGWHPWFPRRLARGGELELDFDPSGMLLRGPDGIPTREVVSPAAGPWDDAFVGVREPPVVRWPGAVEISIHAAGATCWVVYTEQPGAIAVEPQTGPPNGLATGDDAVVEPGAPLVGSMRLAWRRLA